MQSGVILLTKCILDMPSYTYAVKGQRLLRQRGYPCVIKRRSKDSVNGCGYSLYAGRHCGRIPEILDSYSVPYNLRRDGADNDDKLLADSFAQTGIGLWAIRYSFFQNRKTIDSGGIPAG